MAIRKCYSISVLPILTQINRLDIRHKASEESRGGAPWATHRLTSIVAAGVADSARNPMAAYVATGLSFKLAKWIRSEKEHSRCDVRHDHSEFSN